VPFTHRSAAYFLPQHPSQVTGGVPVHVEASPAASCAIASVPNSQIGHDTPVGRHDHTPLTHRSAAYFPPQHPSQMTGGVPGHASASVSTASPAVDSVPASQLTHAALRGPHDHTPLTHRSAAYLLPQHPSQISGAAPGHVEASMESAGVSKLGVLGPPQAIKKPQMSVRKRRRRILRGNSILHADITPASRRRVHSRIPGFSGGFVKPSGKTHSESGSAAPTPAPCMARLGTRLLRVSGRARRAVVVALAPGGQPRLASSDSHRATSVAACARAAARRVRSPATSSRRVV